LQTSTVQNHWRPKLHHATVSALLGQETKHDFCERPILSFAEAEELVTSYSEPLPVVASWGNKCLTPQDILETFGLEPHHNLVISPSVFLSLCPAIVYELDQRLCYSRVDEQHVTEATRTQNSGLFINQ
jgi:hypothetical protein